MAPIDPEQELDFQIARIRAEQAFTVNTAFAVTKFRKAVNDNPTILPGITGLALALSRNGDYAEAVDRAPDSIDMILQACSIPAPTPTF